MFETTNQINNGCPLLHPRGSYFFLMSKTFKILNPHAIPFYPLINRRFFRKSDIKNDCCIPYCHFGGVSDTPYYHILGYINIYIYTYNHSIYIYITIVGSHPTFIYIPLYHHDCWYRKGVTPRLNPRERPVAAVSFPWPWSVSFPFSGLV